MISHQVRQLLQAYIDGELDAASAVELEARLAASPALKREHEHLLALKRLVRESGTRFMPPVAFTGRAFSLLRDRVPKTHPSTVPGWWRPLAISSSLSVAALALFIILPNLVFRSADRQVFEEVVSAHTRSLMADHLTDVRSGDRHTVKPWFSSRLDFSPPVLDLTGEGFVLVGGRLDYIGGKPVAAVVYQFRRHLINLFVWPSADARANAFQSAFHRGYNSASFQSGGMSYWAISDLNANEFGKFVKLLQSGQP